MAIDLEYAFYSQKSPWLIQIPPRGIYPAGSKWHITEELPNSLTLESLGPAAIGRLLTVTRDNIKLDFVRAKVVKSSQSV